MDETWYSKIEGNVITQVQYMLQSRDKAPYPNLVITSVNQTSKPATLPCMYIHELQPVEAGQDLDNVSVNAVLHTMEAQVWTDKGQSYCKDILTSTITELKRMRYNIVAFPTIQTNNGLSWGAIRARRMIGAGDTL